RLGKYEQRIADVASTFGALAARARASQVVAAADACQIIDDLCMRREAAIRKQVSPVREADCNGNRYGPMSCRLLDHRCRLDRFDPDKQVRECFLSPASPHLLDQFAQRF